MHKYKNVKQGNEPKNEFVDIFVINRHPRQSTETRDVLQCITIFSVWFNRIQVIKFQFLITAIKVKVISWSGSMK